MHVRRFESLDPRRYLSEPIPAYTLPFENIKRQNNEYQRFRPPEEMTGIERMRKVLTRLGIGNNIREERTQRVLIKRNMTGKPLEQETKRCIMWADVTEILSLVVRINEPHQATKHIPL